MSRPKTIFRNGTPGEPGTWLPNSVIQNKQMSANARMALILILSLPEDWKFNTRWLMDQLDWGRHTALKAIAEIREKGYATMEQTRSKSGRVGTVVYAFYAKPQPQSEKRTTAPQSENQTPAPQFDSPRAVNRTHTNKIKITNTPLPPLPGFKQAKVGSFAKPNFDCASAEIDPALLRRAEGFGLPVDEIRRKVADKAPENPSAFAQSICRRMIRQRIPGLQDPIIARAMAGDPNAIGKVHELLSLVEIAQ
jgi:hypothetical protein